MEREQGTLTESFSDSVLKQASIQDKTTEEITLHVKPQPVVNDDGSFASLATRIVDEVVATKSPKALAKQVLERVGIGNDGKSAEPQYSMVICVMLAGGQEKLCANKMIVSN